MGTMPIVVGVTPCCGNIMRSSSVSIMRATHSLDLGICPDCDMVLSEKANKRDKVYALRMKRWFHANAHIVNGTWKWNAAEAFRAFAADEIQGVTR